MGMTVADLSHRLGEWDVEIRAPHPSIRGVLAHYIEYLEGPLPVGAAGTLRFLFEAGAPEQTGDAQDERSALGYRFQRRRGELLVSHAHASGTARPDEGEARFVIADSAVRDSELIRDLLSITLAEMLRCRGLFAIHAALAEYRGAGVLVIGQTGAGKSTLSLGMAEAGMGVLTDDWALLEPTETAIRGRALVRTASLPIDQVRPGAMYHVLERREDEALPKVVVTRESLRAPGELRPPLRLVVLASREASAVSVMAPARRSDALARALGQSPLLTADRAGFGRQAAALGRLVEECPLVTFRGGRDVALDPARGGRMILRALETATDAG